MVRRRLNLRRKANTEVSPLKELQKVSVVQQNGIAILELHKLSVFREVRRDILGELQKGSELQKTSAVSTGSQFSLRVLALETRSHGSRRKKHDLSFWRVLFSCWDRITRLRKRAQIRNEAVYAIVSTAIGAGIVRLPQIYSQVGWVVALGLTALYLISRHRAWI